uniref:Uncharacterized protein n=1 Tax=Fundulus heteroclitus TaxID=8078 RepID=A0A146RBL8_FUNHE
MNYIAANTLSPAENDSDHVYRKPKPIHAFTKYEWWWWGGGGFLFVFLPSFPHMSRFLSHVNIPGLRCGYKNKTSTMFPSTTKKKKGERN